MTKRPKKKEYTNTRIYKDTYRKLNDLVTEYQMTKVSILKQEIDKIWDMLLG